MLRRIAFVIENPLDARDYGRFGIDTMLARGIAVDVLDVTRVSRPGYQASATVEPDTTRIAHFMCGDKADLAEAARRMAAADLIVVVMGFSGIGGNLAVYRAIGQSGTPYLVISVNAYPGLNRYIGEPESRGKRLLDIGKRLVGGQIKPLQSLLARLPPAWLGVRPPAYAVYGGEMSDAGANMYPLDSGTRIIHAHALDWEQFAAIRANPPAGENIAVFIDENVGFQRDLAQLGASRPVEPEDYYPRLCALFDRIETELGLSVVIAANPRAGDRSEAFGGRRVERGTTAQLVAASRLVLAHRSTAIGYAVMFGKPVMLLALAKQYRHWANQAAFDAYAKELHQPVQLFDEPARVDLTASLTVDDDRYAVFMQRFVKRPNSPEAPFWDIVLNAVSADCGRHAALGREG